jgi:hypothetical protein
MSTARRPALTPVRRRSGRFVAARAPSTAPAPRRVHATGRGNPPDTAHMAAAPVPARNLAVGDHCCCSSSGTGSRRLPAPCSRNACSAAWYAVQRESTRLTPGMRRIARCVRFSSSASTSPVSVTTRSWTWTSTACGWLTWRPSSARTRSYRMRSSVHRPATRYRTAAADPLLRLARSRPSTPRPPRSSCVAWAALSRPRARRARPRTGSNRYATAAPAQKPSPPAATVLDRSGRRSPAALPVFFARIAIHSLVLTPGAVRLPGAFAP